MENLTESQISLFEDKEKNTTKDFVLETFKKMFEAYRNKFKDTLNLSQKDLADKFSDTILPGFFDFAISNKHIFGSNTSVDLSNFLSVKHGCWLNTVDFMNKYYKAYPSCELAMGFIVNNKDLERIRKDIENEVVPVSIDLIPHGFIISNGKAVFDPTIGMNDDWHYFYQIVPEEVWKSFKYFYNNSKDWWVGDFSDWTLSKIREAKSEKKFYEYCNINEFEEEKKVSNEENNEDNLELVRNERGELLYSKQDVTNNQKRNEYGELLASSENQKDSFNFNFMSDLKDSVIEEDKKLLLTEKLGLNVIQSTDSKFKDIQDKLSSREGGVKSIDIANKIDEIIDSNSTKLLGKDGPFFLSFKTRMFGSLASPAEKFYQKINGEKENRMKKSLSFDSNDFFSKLYLLGLNDQIYLIRTEDVYQFRKTDNNEAIIFDKEYLLDKTDDEAAYEVSKDEWNESPNKLINVSFSANYNIVDKDWFKVNEYNISENPVDMFLGKYRIFKNTYPSFKGDSIVKRNSKNNDSEKKNEENAVSLARKTVETNLCFVLKDVIKTFFPDDDVDKVINHLKKKDYYKNLYNTVYYPIKSYLKSKFNFIKDKNVPFVAETKLENVLKSIDRTVNKLENIFKEMFENYDIHFLYKNEVDDKRTVGYIDQLIEKFLDNIEENLDSSLKSYEKQESEEDLQFGKNDKEISFLIEKEIFEEGFEEEFNELREKNPDINLSNLTITETRDDKYYIVKDKYRDSSEQWTDEEIIKAFHISDKLPDKEKKRIILKQREELDKLYYRRDRQQSILDIVIEFPKACYTNSYQIVEDLDLENYSKVVENYADIMNFKDVLSGDPIPFANLSSGEKRNIINAFQNSSNDYISNKQEILDLLKDRTNKLEELEDQNIKELLSNRYDKLEDYCQEKENINLYFFAFDKKTDEIQYYYIDSNFDTVNSKISDKEMSEGFYAIYNDGLESFNKEKTYKDENNKEKTYINNGIYFIKNNEILDKESVLNKNSLELKTLKDICKKTIVLNNDEQDNGNALTLDDLITVNNLSKSLKKNSLLKQNEFKDIIPEDILKILESNMFDSLKNRKNLNKLPVVREAISAIRNEFISLGDRYANHRGEKKNEVAEEILFNNDKLEDIASYVISNNDNYFARMDFKEYEPLTKNLKIMSNIDFGLPFDYYMKEIFYTIGDLFKTNAKSNLERVNGVVKQTLIDYILALKDNPNRNFEIGDFGINSKKFLNGIKRISLMPKMFFFNLFLDKTPEQVSIEEIKKNYINNIIDAFDLRNVPELYNFFNTKNKASITSAQLLSLNDIIAKAFKQILMYYEAMRLINSNKLKAKIDSGVVTNKQFRSFIAEETKIKMTALKTAFIQLTDIDQTNLSNQDKNDVKIIKDAIDYFSRHKKELSFKSTVKDESGNPVEIVREQLFYKMLNAKYIPQDKKDFIIQEIRDLYELKDKAEEGLPDREKSKPSIITKTKFQQIFNDVSEEEKFLNIVDYNNNLLGDVSLVKIMTDYRNDYTNEIQNRTDFDFNLNDAILNKLNDVQKNKLEEYVKQGLEKYKEDLDYGLSEEFINQKIKEHKEELILDFIKRNNKDLYNIYYLNTTRMKNPEFIKAKENLRTNVECNYFIDELPEYNKLKKAQSSSKLNIDHEEDEIIAFNIDDLRKIFNILRHRSTAKENLTDNSLIENLIQSVKDNTEEKEDMTQKILEDQNTLYTEDDVMLLINEAITENILDDLDEFKNKDYLMMNIVPSLRIDNEILGKYQFKIDDKEKLGIIFNKNTPTDEDVRKLGIPKYNLHPQIIEKILNNYNDIDSYSVKNLLIEFVYKRNGISKAEALSNDFQFANLNETKKFSNWFGDDFENRDKKELLMKLILNNKDFIDYYNKCEEAKEIQTIILNKNEEELEDLLISNKFYEMFNDYFFKQILIDEKKTKEFKNKVLTFFKIIMNNYDKKAQIKNFVNNLTNISLGTFKKTIRKLTNLKLKEKITKQEVLDKINKNNKEVLENVLNNFKLDLKNNIVESNELLLMDKESFEEVKKCYEEFVTDGDGNVTEESKEKVLNKALDIIFNEGIEQRRFLKNEVIEYLDDLKDNTNVTHKEEDDNKNKNNEKLPFVHVDIDDVYERDRDLEEKPVKRIRRNIYRD